MMPRADIEFGISLQTSMLKRTLVHTLFMFRTAELMAKGGAVAWWENARVYRGLQWA